MRLQNDDFGTAEPSLDVPRGKDAGDPLALRVETRDGLPIRLIWRRRRFRITSAVPLACIQGRWWLDWKRGGVRRRTFFVTLDNERGHVFNAELTKQGAIWKLSKIYD
jgi:hypothetical protein